MALCWQQILMLILLFGVTGITIAISFLMPFTATDNETNTVIEALAITHALIFAIAIYFFFHGQPPFKLFGLFWVTPTPYLVAYLFLQHYDLPWYFTSGLVSLAANLSALFTLGICILTVYRPDMLGCKKS